MLNVYTERRRKKRGKNELNLFAHRLTRNLIKLHFHLAVCVFSHPLLLSHGNLTSHPKEVSLKENLKSNNNNSKKKLCKKFSRLNGPMCINFLILIIFGIKSIGNHSSNALHHLVSRFFDTFTQHIDSTYIYLQKICA